AVAVRLRGLAVAVARQPGLGRRALHGRPERGRPGAVGRGEVRLDRLDGLDDVGVGIEDPMAGAGHGRFTCTSSSGPEYAKLRIRLMPGSSTRGPTPQMNASS